jgi:hypothetical protein
VWVDGGVCGWFGRVTLCSGLRGVGLVDAGGACAYDGEDETGRGLIARCGSFSGWAGDGLDDTYGGDETVAAAGEGFDEAGVLGRVAEGFADLIDGGAEGVVEVDDGVFAPETGLEFFAGYYLAGLLKESSEDLEGLALELDAESGFPELSGLQIDLVETEAESRIGNLARHFNTKSSRSRLYHHLAQMMGAT